ALESIPGYKARHQVMPGLTGLTQIFASRSLPRRQKFRFDLLYIQKQSFLLDVQFIALSFWIVFRGRCGEPWVRRRQINAQSRQNAPAGALYGPAASTGIARIRTVIEQ